jgi:hypothetical protein
VREEYDGACGLMSAQPPMSTDGRDVCTIVIIAAGLAIHQRCVNGEAKAAAVWCGHCPSAPSAEKRCINPRPDGNSRKFISPRERTVRVAAMPTVRESPVWPFTVRWVGVSANLLYGFGPIILQSHGRDAVKAHGTRAADAVIGGREASATPSV